MSNTYFTSMSGMMAASYGLQNTSNNMANMQSPGFKKNDVFYSSLGNGNGEEGLGSGVCIGGNTTNFNEGKYLSTDNPSDLAIKGQGFFVIRLKSGEILYTRDGEFGFNNKGILVDRHSGGEVQGYDRAGNLAPIHEKGPKFSPGKATTEVFLKGQFSKKEKTEEDKNDPDPYKSKYENVKFSIAQIYDASGKAHNVTLEFRSTPVRGNEPKLPDDGTSWDLVDITCDDGTPITIPPGQKIIFSGTDQGPSESNQNIKFALNGNQNIVVQFGNSREGAESSVQLKDAKLIPEGTKIETLQNDGYGKGQQISFAFDEHGQISYQYDNNQTIAGIYVCLARFDDMEHFLVPTQDNLYRCKNDSGTHIGRANQDGFGFINAKQLESSNVDSTTEFANIVILQRMFQACSQIMDIDKQLLEELESK